MPIWLLTFETVQIRDRSFFTREEGGQWDLEGGIDINQAQRGGLAKKSSQEMEAMYPTSLTYGVGLFIYTKHRGGRRFFVRTTKENALLPLLKNYRPLVSQVLDKVFYAGILLYVTVKL